MIVITMLKSAVFFECNFCAVSEKGKSWKQALVLPEQIKDLTCVNSYGSQWTEQLVRDSSNSNGIRFWLKKVSCQSGPDDKFWSELKRKHGNCYETDDNESLS